MVSKAPCTRSGECGKGRSRDKGSYNSEGHQSPHHTTIHTNYERRMQLEADRLLMIGNRGAYITCQKKLSIASEKRRSG